MYRRRRGFTFVEMLVIIAAMAIMLGAMMPSLWSAMYLRRKIITQEHMDAIKEAVISYYKAALADRRQYGVDRHVLPGTVSNGKADDSFWADIRPHLKGAVEDVRYDGWGRPFVVYVHNVTPSGNWCPLKDYRDYVNGNTSKYASLPKVVIISGGKNKRIDSDTSDVLTNPNWEPSGDDIAVVILTTGVDTEGDDYTRARVRDVALAAQNYYMQRFLAKSEETGSVSEALKTNYFQELGTTIQQLRDKLSYSDSDVRDFWGNYLQWNCCVRNTAPHAASVSSPCGYTMVVQGIM